MEHSNIIKIVPNFLSEQEVKFWVDFNDYCLKTKNKNMAHYVNNLRPVLQFGKDKCETHYATNTTLDLISEIEAETRQLFDLVISKTKNIFQESRDMHMAGFWLSKQLPGAYIGEHEDTDEGINSHFLYSAVLYLNELETTGDLIFTELNYRVKPKAGDLVVFKSSEGGKHKVDRINENRYTLAFWMTNEEEFAL